jgi:hypothetical protein
MLEIGKLRLEVLGYNLATPHCREVKAKAIEERVDPQNV